MCALPFEASPIRDNDVIILVFVVDHKSSLHRVPSDYDFPPPVNQPRTHRPSRRSVVV